MRFTCLQLLFGDALSFATHPNFDAPVGEQKPLEIRVIRSIKIVSITSPTHPLCNKRWSSLTDLSARCRFLRTGI